MWVTGEFLTLGIAVRGANTATDHTMAENAAPPAQSAISRPVSEALLNEKVAHPPQRPHLARDDS